MNFRTLDLNLLRVFAAVMLERNVTRAAAQLAMTQPAVSNALRRLREATGDELFVTVPSGVLPTAACGGDGGLHVERGARTAAARRSTRRASIRPRDPRSFTMAMADATATVLMPALRRRPCCRERALADVRVLPLVVARPAAAARAGQRRRRASASSRTSPRRSPPRATGRRSPSIRSTAASTSA